MPAQYGGTARGERDRGDCASCHHRDGDRTGGDHPRPAEVKPSSVSGMPAGRPEPGAALGQLGQRNSRRGGLDVFPDLVS
jgi:hypothetical protein